MGDRIKLLEVAEEHAVAVRGASFDAVGLRREAPAHLDLVPCPRDDCVSVEDCRRGL